MILCLGCIYCHKVRVFPSQDQQGIICCSAIEQAEKIVSGDEFFTKLYNHRKEKEGQGYICIYPVSECAYYKPSAEAEGKLICSPFDWQKYRDVQVH